MFQIRTRRIVSKRIFWISRSLSRFLSIGKYCKSIGNCSFSSSVSSSFVEPVNGSKREHMKSSLSPNWWINVSWHSANDKHTFSLTFVLMKDWVEFQIEIKYLQIILQRKSIRIAPSRIISRILYLISPTSDPMKMSNEFLLSEFYMTLLIWLWSHITMEFDSDLLF